MDVTSIIKWPQVDIMILERPPHAFNEDIVLEAPVTAHAYFGTTVLMDGLIWISAW